MSLLPCCPEVLLADPLASPARLALASLLALTPPLASSLSSSCLSTLYRTCTELPRTMHCGTFYASLRPVTLKNTHPRCISKQLHPPGTGFIRV